MATPRELVCIIRYEALRERLTEAMLREGGREARKSIRASIKRFGREKAALRAKGPDVLSKTAGRHFPRHLPKSNAAA